MNEKFVAKATRLIVALLVAAACLPVLTKSDEPVKAAKPSADPMIGNEAGQVRDDNGLVHLREQRRKRACELVRMPVRDDDRGDLHFSRISL